MKLNIELEYTTQLPITQLLNVIDLYNTTATNTSNLGELKKTLVHSLKQETEELLLKLQVLCDNIN